MDTKCDLAPICSLQLHRTYRQLQVGRLWRARFAQKFFVPMVAFWGQYGTSMPYRHAELQSNVVGTVFSTVIYPSTPCGVRQCHFDYLSFLIDQFRYELGTRGFKTRVRIVNVRKGQILPSPELPDGCDADFASRGVQFPWNPDALHQPLYFEDSLVCAAQ